MTIHVDFGALQKTRWYEFALRGLFGGLITVATGVIARRYGPVLGGLFLAFPAIPCHSLSFPVILCHSLAFEWQGMSFFPLG